MEISLVILLWIKTVHIIAVISWMAGLLYLPRLFIYHCGSEKGSDKSETFKVMERRLLNVIMNPAMFISFLTGGLMVYSYGPMLIVEPWFIVKAGCLFILITVHMSMVKWRSDFEADINQKTKLFFRIINEIPTILLIIIIIMVVVKPF
jgi:putative membrane protein